MVLAQVATAAHVTVVQLRLTAHQWKQTQLAQHQIAQRARYTEIQLADEQIDVINSLECE